MGKYKDENGKSRAGNLLKKISGTFPDLLDVTLEAATSGNPIAAIGGAIKEAVKRKLGSDDPEERMNAQELLTEIELEMKFIQMEQENVTERWRLDMNSDSWLSKNIRPMVLIFLLMLMTVLVIWDSATHGVIEKGAVIVADSFQVDAKYVKLLADLLWIVFLAYFGGRTIEKFKKK